MLDDEELEDHEIDEETRELMIEHNLVESDAEIVKAWMDEGVDEDEAVELADLGEEP